MELDEPVGDSQVGAASATERTAEEKTKQNNSVRCFRQSNTRPEQDTVQVHCQNKRTAEAEHTLTTIKLDGENGESF